MKTTLLATLFLLSACASAQDFPFDWWRPVPREDAQSWEILPQDARDGEVILSKRTELGVFSHFAATPITLDGEQYASIEGLWQSLKYPDPAQPQDPRHAITGWEHTRAEVAMMVASEAKAAGSKANALYRRHNLKNISYGSQFFDYVDHAEGSRIHLGIIRRAMSAKLEQTAGLWDLLLKTKCLALKPDHKVGDNDPPAYRYYELYMNFREERAPCSF
jgi:predicted NAD-dependent protein-ADP-ribosyltransferase YbiA (DUF1768 family)